MRALFFLLLFTPFLACDYMPKEQEFKGSEEARKKANEMFKAIGGKSAWCSLKSLYIRAEHTEPDMVIPYTSEIWLDMDSLSMVIHQENDSFHVKGIFSESEGRIYYLDQRDTFRILSEEQLDGWKFSNAHNVYVLLHNMGCNPASYSVELVGEDSLLVYNEQGLQGSFGLDGLSLPEYYGQLQEDGSIASSQFTEFGKTEVFVHSAGGRTLNGSFQYKTDEWIPSKKSMLKTFGQEVLNPTSN